MTFQERELAIVRRGGAEIGGSVLREKLGRGVGFWLRLFRQSFRYALSDVGEPHVYAIARRVKDTRNFKRSVTFLFERRTYPRIAVEIIDEPLRSR